MHFFSLVLILTFGLAKAQDERACYTSGSIALSVILSIIFTAALLAALFVLWKKYRKPKELILETDPEKGKTDYAFDNPTFKDPGLTPIAKSEANKAKWSQWSPLTALITKSEKRKTLDDSAINGSAVKVVTLRSHDFTGLGFNICGNMKEGIYIKDVLHRGPASESGKLNPGDRIENVTISFEHIVYEDALTILSYASPYEVVLEARGGKTVGGQAARPSHPIYRSSSYSDLFQVGSSTKRRLFPSEEHAGSLSSNYSSLQKSRSNMTTLERKNSESPKIVQKPLKKTAPKTQFSPEQLKIQLEQKIIADHAQNLRTKNEQSIREDLEVEKTENKLQKFGVRVLPPEESSNHINLNKQPLGIDEVDEKKPPVKKRERKVIPEEPPQTFVRDEVVNGSGIKRDANGIPQEIPNYMMNAAVAARTNRRGSEDMGRGKDEELDKTPKKTKGKAPAPPEEKLAKYNLDEIHSVIDDVDNSPKKNIHEMAEEDEVELRNKTNIKEYNSDSDMEADNQSSVNTIELNSSDITIHHAEDNDEKQSRRTASTGDLTKMQRTRKPSSGTLERAQSLDITDAGIPSTLTKKRKGGRIEDDMGSEEDIFGKVMMSKEPRLSLILDGLNTFQRNRLKKSTEWGNLEDAILKFKQEDESWSSSNQNISLENINFGFGEKTEEFDAVVNKINEIKRESLELSSSINDQTTSAQDKSDKKIKNQIWPPFEAEALKPKSNGSTISSLDAENDSRLLVMEKRQRKPFNLEPTEVILPPDPVVDKKITKPAIPEKKDFLLSPRKKGNFLFEYNNVNKQEETENTVVANRSDESKTVHPIQNAVHTNLTDLTRNFISSERIACSQEEDAYRYLIKNDTNVSDDIKVSRHSLGSLERPKSDDAKMNVSNITVNSLSLQDDENLHSLELNVNEIGHTKADDVRNKLENNSESSKITISAPDIIENVTITEAINKLNHDVSIQGPSSLTLEIPDDWHTKNQEEPLNTNQSSLTYITEIQVLTPTNTSSVSISEMEIVPNVNTDGRNLDNEFEDYIRSFESNVKNFESNIQQFENRVQPKFDLETVISNDAEKEMNKIHEIAEQQLKKLPEMRFSTSSYETPNLPEKRQSQIELLRSNFERSPPKNVKVETKSRIPIATSTKTPPTSPERRNSRNLDMETDKDILELMSSVPVVPKPQIKPPNKNVTVTSIRSNSKIPSGLPVLGGTINRPNVSPKKHDDDHVVQVSTNGGGMESSFKQWVFNPSDHAITNIAVTENKQQK